MTFMWFHRRGYDPPMVDNRDYVSRRVGRPLCTNLCYSFMLECDGLHLGKIKFEFPETFFTEKLQPFDLWNKS